MATGNRRGLYAKWTCQDGIPNDFELIKGKWSHWEPARKGLAAAAVARIPGNNAVAFALPVEIPQAPLRIVAKIWIPAVYARDKAYSTSGLQASWIREDFTQPEFHNLSYVRPFRAQFDEPKHYDLFVYKQFIWREIREARHIAALYEYLAPYPARRLSILVFGYALESLEIEEIDESRLPRQLCDQEALKRMIITDRVNWRPAPKMELMPAGR